MIYHFHIQVPYDYLSLRKKKKNSFLLPSLNRPRNGDKFCYRDHNYYIILFCVIYCIIYSWGGEVKVSEKCQNFENWKSDTIILGKYRPTFNNVSFIFQICTFFTFMWVPLE